VFFSRIKHSVNSVADSEVEHAGEQAASVGQFTGMAIINE